MKRLAFAAALILLPSAALAGESISRAYGFGPAWYESKCPLNEFNWDATTREEALRCVKRPTSK